MTPDHDEKRTLDYAVMTRPSAVATWGWFILKNVVGWLLIISSVPLGAFIPGPGGIPLLLIGFGLITFPGKRRLVAGLLHGRPIAPRSWWFGGTVIVLALFLPAAVMFYLTKAGWITPDKGGGGLDKRFATAFVVSAVLLGWAGLWSLPLINKFLS